MFVLLLLLLLLLPSKEFTRSLSSSLLARVDVRVVIDQEAPLIAFRDEGCVSVRLPA